MAEYAGLEIRIGGNTTKLTNALKASTKSAAELQSRIRQATRAMQFDPTDLKNVETRIKVTGDRMQSLQSKAQLAKTAIPLCQQETDDTNRRIDQYCRNSALNTKAVIVYKICHSRCSIEMENRDLRNQTAVWQPEEEILGKVPSRVYCECDPDISCVPAEQ